jgi:hypothetical protein
VKVNGDTYYQYGTYQGSGDFWYGTLLKINSATGKNSVIVKNMYDDKIYYYGTQIFYYGIEDASKCFIYNTKSGKTSTSIYKLEDTEGLSILGEKSYCIKVDGKDYITVSEFSTGTDKKDLKKDFIKISCNQNSKYSYSASVKQLGNYLLIPVVCTDYSDESFGWRGKCVGIHWYVADMSGKTVADFQ